MPNPDTTFADLETRDVSKIAALDIGSNSFHLVVARVVAGSVQVLHKVKQKVRLASGLDENDNLSEEAIERGLAALELVAQSLKGFDPDTVRIVATFTLRKANNASEFVRRARKILPYPVEIIAGTEEARLIYMGVAHTTHSQGKTLIVDIGGGSTEFALGEGFSPLLLRSLEMGCVSFTQHYFNKGELTKKAFKRAITAAEQELEMIEKRYITLGWQEAVGTSGTIKTISEVIRLSSSDQQDGSITLKKLDKLAEKTLSLSHVSEIQFDGVSDDRREVFVAGLAILTAVFRCLQIKKMTYSSAALREGVLYEMEDQLSHSSVRDRTAESLATRYDVDTEHARRVLTTTLSLFDQVKSAWQIDCAELRQLIGWGALLHEVGLQINSRRVQRHSSYILENVDLPGFNQEEQLILAQLALLHRNKIKQHRLVELQRYSEEQISRLVALLRLGVLFNIKRQDNFLPELVAKAKKQQITLRLPLHWLDDKPIISADLQREQEQIKALGLELVIDNN